MENSTTATALQALGFGFNPFEHLEASSDPYLHEYLVGHEIFSVLWDESPAFLFAPAGGGKTAMRIYTFRSCWLESGMRNKFPIPYYLPNYFENSGFETFDEHLAGISRAGAVALLLSISYRPKLFWGLSNQQQTRLFSFINQHLPGNLAQMLDTLEQTQNPAKLARILDRNFIISAPPSMADVSDLCRAIKKMDYLELSKDLAPRDQIRSLQEIVLSDLGFRSVFILLDGIDGFPDLGLNSTKAIKNLAQLFDHTGDLAKEGTIIKAFLPIDAYQKTQTNAPNLKEALISTLNWDIPSLAELLRKRVYVATKGYFGSLDAISSIGLRDIELLLAKAVLPLPREAVLIAKHLLDSTISRSGVELNKIETEDVEAAIQWYKDDQMAIASSVILSKSRA